MKMPVFSQPIEPGMDLSLSVTVLLMAKHCCQKILVNANCDSLKLSCKCSYLQSFLPCEKSAFYLLKNQETKRKNATELPNHPLFQKS